MECKICGKPTEDQNDICKECAERYSEQYTMPLEEPFNLTTPSDVTEKKNNKSKKWLWIGIGVACVIALTVTLLLVFGVFGQESEEAEDYEEEILTFNSPQEQFDYLVKDSVVSAFDAESSAQFNKSEIHVLLGKTIQELLAVEMEMPAKWLKDICLTTQYDISDRESGVEIGIGLDKTSILTLQCFQDSQLMRYLIGLPELSDQYLKIDMKALMEASGVDMDSLVPAGGFQMDMAALKPLVSKYWELFVSGLGEVNEAQETITVDGISQNCTKLRVSVSEAQCAEILLSILREAKSDQQLQDLMTSLFESLDYQLTMSNFEQSLDETIARFEQLKESADTTENVFYDIFVDEKNHVIGHALTNVEGESIYWKKATADGKFAFSAEIPDTLKISGSGTVKNRKESGTYDVVVDGEQLLTVKVKNITENKKKGTSSGTVTIIPGAELVNEMVEAFSGVGYPADLSLEFAWDNKKDSASGSFKIFVADELLAGITVDSSQESVSLEKPSEGVDIMNDPEGLKNWILGLNFEKVIKNFEKADVPDSLIKQIKQITDLLPLYLSGT